MDIVSHALWGATIVRQRPLCWWALLFGAGPDILGSGPGFVYLLTKGVLWGTGAWALLPTWAMTSYHLWHSLLGCTIVIVLLTAFGRVWLVLAWPYLLHVGMDLFTHQGDVLARLLYPFVASSSTRVTGLNWWESPWVWGANFLLLAAINLWFWLRRKQ